MFTQHLTIVTTVWFYFLLVNSANADLACPYKECMCAGPEIMCEDLDLPAIPPISGSNSGFVDLLMDGNKITEIPAGSLPSGLTSITMTFTPLTTIDNDAFDGSATTLHSLTFSRARFPRIPDAFLHLQVLKYINIYDTKILDWNEDVMKKIGQTVSILNLENVGLTSWPPWLYHFTNLIELTLDSSNISSVPDDALDLLITNLSGLSISNGSLTSVPKSVSNLLALETLHLHDNKISNLTWLPQSSKLSELSLNNNKLSNADDLSSAMRPYADSLQSLDLVYNQLTAIPDFSFLVQIHSLDLSHNRISNPSSGSMPPGIYEFDLSYNLLPSIPSLWSRLTSVSSITLSHNAIREIRATDFHSSITQVDLNHNLITEILDSSFPSDFGLLVLVLSNNPITTISNHAFDGLHSLTALNLQDTKLTRMPLALATLGSLYTLDMSNCSDLVCTCMEKILADSILSMKQVYGQCGRMGIHDFYATLSPTCPA